MDKLECKNIRKEYGSKVVIPDCTLTLEKGKIYGLIGRNGAGKTTLLSMMSAQINHNAGEILWNGQKVWENAEALAHICFAREIQINVSDNGFLGMMKVSEYLKTAACFYVNWDQAMAKELLQKFGVSEEEKLQALSKGMLSAVSIIVALSSKADFTFLDEPVAGLDVIARDLFYKLVIEEYDKTGRTFVISSHLIDEATNVFEEVLIMKEGNLIVQENLETLTGRAIEVTGLESNVDAVTKGLQIYHPSSIGRKKSVMVLLEEGQELQGLSEDMTVTPMSLQNIFIGLCGE